MTLIDTQNSLAVSALKKFSLEQECFHIPVNIDLGDRAIARSQPVSFGVPLPLGTRPESGRLIHEQGACVPVQLEPMSHWSDGSVRWMLVDAILPDGYPTGLSTLELSAGEALDSSELTDGQAEEERVSVSDSDKQIVIETGAAQFQIDRNVLRPLGQVFLKEVGLLSSAGCRLVVTDSSGQKFEAVCDGWSVETTGPVRATIVGEGYFPQLKNMHATVRVSFFAKSGLVRMEVAAHNPNRAQHPDGLWDLGDEGSLLFRDLSIEVGLAKERATQDIRFIAESGYSASTTSDHDWNLYQDSSGGEDWDSVNHVNREGKVNTTFQGFRIDSGAEVSTGLRAEPIVEVRTRQGRAAFVMPHFWQQFPKALSVSGDDVRIGLFPHEFGDLHELQGGERKIHTIWMRFHNEESQLEELDWIRHSASIRPSVEWCDATGGMPTLQFDESRQLTELDALLTEAVEGDKGVLAQREKVDEYGWRNFGEIYASHEEAYYQDSKPLISHYNNQYDMIHGFLLQYLRTGKRSWLKLGDDLAQHVVDIDIYHTTQDKAAYNGGLFWLTDHYVHAHTATHRTYSKHNRPENGIYGGGPAAEHNFTSGLLLHYFLTGNSNSRAAVQQLADWVITMEDGRRTILGIVDDSFTGQATGSMNYQGPNRGGGFSINSLLDAWTLTRRDEYLQAAERLIRRCVHPHDDIDRHDLLNVESRWSYTVFLTSISKYLDVKAQSGQLDRMYAYAQASLLHYAKWMLKHEKPYFDQVESLEFPTEAWAVQEFRKANVMRLAASHAEDDVRYSLMQRGEEFSDRAWQDLMRFETRTNARSLAIMMIEGMTDCRLRIDVVKSTLKADSSLYINFGEPEQFVSQKQKVKCQLRQPMGIAKAVASTLNPMRWHRYLRLKNSEL